jgi:methylated-DNA-[protein]-cysteine S-methyltransferase
MKERGAALFTTPLGRCGIAWTGRGIAALQLPEATDDATLTRLLERAPGAPLVPNTRHWPDAVRRTVKDIVLLLKGKHVDLSTAPLDLEDVPPFHRRVYEAARAVLAGKTCSYGELASALGSPGAARAVGQALGRNPFALIVPCHRVLATGGGLGGFSANGGTTTKKVLLELEAEHGGADASADSVSRSPVVGRRKGLTGTGFGFDPDAAVAALRSADPRLRRLIDRVGPFGLQLNETTSVFAALAESIVYQQLTGKAAATIYGRVCNLFEGGPQGLEPKALLATSEEHLRGAGLSRSKAASLRDLAERTLAGGVPSLRQAHALSDETLIEQLTSVRGIGRWTVQMLLMFRLGRGDVLPVDDLGIQKGFALTFGGGEPVTRAQVADWGERWRPFRTVASWYLWRAVDLAKGQGGGVARTASRTNPSRKKLSLPPVAHVEPTRTRPS